LTFGWRELLFFRLNGIRFERESILRATCCINRKRERGNHTQIFLF
jgi:hypothetical protein